ncbi:MAG: Gfo/Idh/MocA family oxidoreductase [Actinomycetota bacterium]|nr:Gfo/Idh/MocA family oxidoreductase [Actinomycetota bacterium]
MAEPHRVAVVGLGIGTMHVWSLRRMKDRFTVAAVCDLDEAKAREVATRIRAEVLTFEEVLARDDIRVVDLCTPPAAHLGQITAALRAGKDVVCEKPLVASLADVDELAGVGAETSGSLMPIFQYRFGNGLQKVRALVDAGVAGPVRTSSVEVAWRRRADYYAVPWRGRWATELGGVLLSQAVHALDMLTYVVGPPARVFCRASTRVNAIEVEDCAAASLEMADGSLATVAANLGSAQEITRHRFHFERFSAESGTSAYESSSDPWEITPDDPDAAAAIAAVVGHWTARPEGWWGQFERYADALDGDAALPVTLTDARASIEVITALYASARTGVDVELPIPPDHPLYGGWLP